MAEFPRTHLGDAGRGSSRSVAAQRWGALIGGSALAIYGLTRKSPLGIALAAGGSTIALLGTTQKSARPTSAWTSLLVNVSPQEAYQFWREFEDLPLFMTRIESVKVLDERRSRWIAVGPWGRPIRWDAEITSERENEYIAWHSLPGSDVHVDGRVEFQKAPADRGTLISVRIEYRAPVGGSNALANFLNKGINFALRQDLRRLEALMETGEIPTTEGQPHGPRDLVTSAARLADPTRPIRGEANLRDVFAAKRGIA